MYRGGLAWEEWCFDQIGRELFLCIYWEYARESRTIRAHLVRFRELREKLRERQASETQAVRRSGGRKQSRRVQEQLNQLEAFHKLQIDDFLRGFTNHFPEHFAIPGLLDSNDEGLVKDWRVALPMFATTVPGRIVLEPDHFPHTNSCR